MKLGKLSSLPTRPPTPPKDFSSSDPIVPMQEGKFLSTTLLDTPETPTIFVPEYFAARPPGRGTKRKRVDFVLTPTHHDSSDLPSSPPTLPTTSPNTNRPALLPRQPNTAPRPTKSILKSTSHGLLSDISLDTEELLQFKVKSPLTLRSDKVKMINNICEQLAADDKSERLAAYQSLGSALRENNDIVKYDEFQRHLVSMVGFIHRDLKGSLGPDHRDGQLGVEALKTANGLAWKEVLADTTLTSFLNWCCATLSNPKASKAIVNNTLLLITCIKTDRVFSQSQGSKLFEALKDLHLRVNGKQILLLRLNIYKKLASLQQPCIITGARIWLRQLLDAMLNSKKEIVQRALSFGREAAISHGTRKEISHALVNVFQEPSPYSHANNDQVESEDLTITKPYSGYFIPNLNRLLSDPDTADRVPQVWSIIILLMRHRSRHFRKWDHWGQWLTLLQKCFNASDSNLKCMANAAWRDLIWASQDEILGDSVVRKSLLRPIVGQLERDDKDRSRSETESTFCALLYCALHPGVNKTEMTIVWDEYVSKALHIQVGQKQMSRPFKLDLLQSLLGGDELKTWNKDRALQAPKIGPIDLLRLDPHWICANTDAILSVLGSLFTPETHAQTSAARNDDQPSFIEAWNRLIASLSEVSRREVRSSVCIIKSVASVVTFVFQQTTGSCDSAESYNLATKLFGILMSHVKALPLDQKCLIQSGLTVTASKDSGSKGPLVSASELILDFLAPPCSSKWANFTSAEEFSRVLDAHLTSFASKISCLAEISSLSAFCTCDYPVNSSGNKEDHLCHKTLLWNEIADRYIEIFKQNLQTKLDSQHLDGYLAGGIIILKNGLCHGDAIYEDWVITLGEMSSRATAELGVSGFVSAVLAPISSALIEYDLPHKELGIPSFLSNFGLKVLELIPALVANDKRLGKYREPWNVSPVEQRTEIVLDTLLMELLSTSLLSSETNLVHAAIQNWYRITASIDTISIPGHLFLALKRATQTIEVNFEKIETGCSVQGPVDAPIGWDRSNREASSFDISGYTNSVESNQTRVMMTKATKDDRPSTPVKPACSARIIDPAVEIPSSPPEFHHTKAASPCALDMPEQSDVIHIEDIPLPALPPFSHHEQVDASPSPAPRRLPHAQSDLANLDFLSSSPNTVIKNSNAHSDPVRSLAVAEMDSSPTKPRRTRSMKDRKSNRTAESRYSQSVVMNMIINEKLPSDLWGTSAVDSSCPGQATEISIGQTQEEKIADQSVESSRMPRSSSHKRKLNTSSQEDAILRKRTSSRRSTRSLTRSLTSLERPDKVTDVDLENRIPVKSNKPDSAIEKKKRGRPRKSAILQNDCTSSKTSTKEISDIEDCIIVGSSECSRTLQDSASVLSQTLRRKPSETLKDANEHDAPVEEEAQRVFPQEHTRLPITQNPVARTVDDKKRKHTKIRNSNEPIELESDTTAQNSESLDEDWAQSSSKRPKLTKRAQLTPHTPKRNIEETVGTPKSALSATAQNIFARLRGLLGDVQKAVLGRSEARNIHRTLNQLNSAVLDAEERYDQK